MHHESSAEMRACIQACLECYRVCLETALGHCLEQGGEHVEPRHFRIMLDCASYCRTSAEAMIRRSDLHGEACGLCAHACERCAAECDRFTDEAMRGCAAVCRDCAAHCHGMAGAATQP